MLALATAEDMLIDHVDINQAFLQGDMLEEDGFEGNVYISPRQESLCRIYKNRQCDCPP